jgi:hypothetical protein
MNTGTSDSNYGYWYPGLANDGAAGGGFEPAPFGMTWLDQPHHRGAWYYACETDLGYCAALRAAATVLADDPIFGRYCFGGDERATAAGIEVVPKDGLRQRFHAMLTGGKLQLCLTADRFAAMQPMVVAADCSAISFLLESDNPAPHRLRMRVAGMKAGTYSASAGGQPAVEFLMRDGGETLVEIPIAESGQQISIRPGRVNPDQ